MDSFDLYNIEGIVLCSVVFIRSLSKIFLLVLFIL